MNRRPLLSVVKEPNPFRQSRKKRKKGFLPKKLRKNHTRQRALHCLALHACSCGEWSLGFIDIAMASNYGLGGAFWMVLLALQYVAHFSQPSAVVPR